MMKFFALLLCGCVLAAQSTAQDKAFREDEMRLIAKEFVQVIWRLGQENKGKFLSTKEIEAAIERFLQGKPSTIDDEKKSRDALDDYQSRREQTIDFARWLIEVSSRAEEYAFTPSLSIRSATPKDWPIHENCIIWKISLTAFRETFTWLIGFEDSEKVEINDAGQRIPKIIVIFRILSTAPASAGALS